VRPNIAESASRHSCALRRNWLTATYVNGRLIDNAEPLPSKGFIVCVFTGALARPLPIFFVYGLFSQSV